MNRSERSPLIVDRFVGRMDAEASVTHDAHRDRRLKRRVVIAWPQELHERLAIDPLERQERHFVDGPELERRAHIRVMNARRKHGLIAEKLGNFLFVREVGKHRLERHEAMKAADADETRSPNARHSAKRHGHDEFVATKARPCTKQFGPNRRLGGIRFAKLLGLEPFDVRCHGPQASHGPVEGAPFPFPRQRPSATLAPMDSLPVIGAAVAALGFGVFLVRKFTASSTTSPATAPALTLTRASMPPRPSLRPSAAPQSFRESMRNVFVDPALNKNGVGFGKKCEWIVAKTSPETMAAAVGVTGSPMPWREALARAVGGKGVAVLGPVDGLCFAVGEPSTFRIGKDHLLDDTNLFVRVADAVGREVLFFQSDARAEGFAWLRARPGLVERAFSVVDTHTLADEGPQDEIEEHVRGQRPVPDGEEWWPSEEDVLEMAAGWSVDPWGLDDRPVGDLPCLFAPRT